MKLFGIMIAGGFSSEVSVGSRMLGNAPDVEPLLTVHSLDGVVARAVETASKSKVIEFDAGWRPNPDATRPTWAKVGSWAKLGTILPKVIRDARRFEPDVIYSSQQRWDCSLASAVALALGKPQIVHLHYVPGPWLGRLAQQRLRDCAQVVTVSEFTRQLAIEHGARAAQVATVLNSINYRPAEPEARQRVRAELGFSEEHRLIGNVARFSETKGQSETIEAFATFAAEVPTARLVMVGDGAIRQALQEQASSLKIADRVVFTGSRNDVGACLAAFDAFVHPSFLDPCPLAVLEAQAAGLPVAAFADGGIPEIVAHGETGLLSPTRNIAQLAADMKQLAIDSQLSKRLGAAGAERMRAQFSEPTAGKRFSNVLRELLSR